MIQRTMAAGAIVLCLAGGILTDAADCRAKEPAAKGSAGSKAPPPAAVTELHAAIERIFVKNHRIHIQLATSGAGRIAPDAFRKVLVRLETSKGSRQWTLVEVDPARSLARPDGGRIEFDTGVILEKGETVKAVLRLGTIEKFRLEALHPTPAAALAGRDSAQSTSPTRASFTGAIDRRSAAPGPATASFDDSGGIRVTVPGEGQVQKPGDTIIVTAFFLNALPDPTAVGQVEFALRKSGSSRVFATARQPYRQSSDDRNCQTRFVLPSTGLPSGPDYYFTATHPEARGIGHKFTVQAPEMAIINVLRPRAGDRFTPGFPIRIDYQFSRHVGDGPITFNLYETGIGDALVNEGAVVRRPKPVLSFSRSHRSGAAGPAEPIHTLSYTLPRELAVGRYHLELRHPEAVGGSADFELLWEIGGTGEEGPPPCDYGLVSASFGDGGSLESGLSVGPGPTVTGTFKVRVRWNGSHIPPGYAPGTVFPYTIRVQSANTGAAIGSGTFRYGAGELINVNVPFSFPKDSLPRMSRGRNIPLEFRLEPGTGSVDSDAANNLLAADMRVLNASESDIEIDLAFSDFSLTRTPHAAPLDDYHLTQRFKVRNLSRNDAGGAPAPMPVTVRYCLDRTDADSWGSGCGLASGTIVVAEVGAEWSWKTWTHSFREVSPMDIPSGRRYRLTLEADPERLLIDADRGNNVDALTFRITEPPPGAGSGVVVE